MLLTQAQKWNYYHFFFCRILILVDLGKKAKVFGLTICEHLVKEQLIMVYTLELGVHIQFCKVR